MSIKKFILFACVTLVMFISVSHVVLAQNSGEQIDNYDVEIKVYLTGAIGVTEKIQYNFGSNQRHGIFRDVPISYRTPSGLKMELDLEDIFVSDENGQTYQISTSKSGGERHIKIGDPDVYVTGVKTYVIRYEVPLAVGFFDSHDEIYWNAIGSGWDVPIHNARVRVELPDYAETYQQACYIGEFGSQSGGDCMIQNLGFGTFEFVAERSLNPREGITIAASFEKGFVTEPTAWQRFMTGFLREGWYWLLVPVIVFALMYRIWSRKGRDPKGSGVIVAQYESPDNLSPMQIGYLNDRTFAGRGLSAEIVYLATKGYLKISHVAKKGIFTSEDYELELLKSADDSILPFQKRLLEKLFAAGSKVLISSFKHSFYTKAQEVQEDCLATLVDAGYLPQGTSMFTGTTVQRLSLFSFLGVFAMAFGGVFIGVFTGSLIAILAYIATVAILVVFLIIMPRLTEKGVHTREYIAGLKLYLTVAEKDRINFHNAPEKRPEQFEKFLPFAMALGVEKQWAEVFKDLHLAQPNWYNDASLANFNAAAFATNMSSFSKTSASSLATSPGSSSGSGGGGFSGGGGGGGGGGSW